jgi:excisionase family DNA binding protein
MSDVIKWHTFDEIAKYLDISRDTLTRLIKEQSSSAYKVGIKHKFDVQEVDSWGKEDRNNKDN